MRQFGFKKSLGAQMRINRGNAVKAGGSAGPSGAARLFHIGLFVTIKINMAAMVPKPGILIQVAESGLNPVVIAFGLGQNFLAKKKRVL